MTKRFLVSPAVQSIAVANFGRVESRLANYGHGSLGLFPPRPNADHETYTGKDIPPLITETRWDRFSSLSVTTRMTFLMKTSDPARVWK
jgi:hypothetical protein